MFAAVDVDNLRKGFDLLEQAVASLPIGSDVTLVTVGSGSKKITSRINAIHLGRIADERLMSMAFSAADVFVMPTRAEAFGQVVFEAMACGTPVVAFDVGGVPDMVRHEETGLLAPPEDATALGAAVTRVLDDHELRARLSRRCRQVAVEEYALDIQAQRYVEVYGDLLEASAQLRKDKRSSFRA